MAEQHTKNAGKLTDAQIEALMPMYINGMLSGSDLDNMERAIASNPIWRAKACAERKLAQAFQQLDEMDVPTERSLAAMHARIADAERQGGMFGRFNMDFSSVLGGLKPQFAIPVGAAAALALAVVVWPGAEQGPGEGSFTVATESPAAIDGPVLRIKVADGIADAALAELLQRHELELAGKPGETGVLTVKLPQGSDPQKIADALKKEQAVLFVGSGAAQ